MGKLPFKNPRFDNRSAYHIDQRMRTVFLFVLDNAFSHVKLKWRRIICESMDEAKELRERWRKHNYCTILVNPKYNEECGTVPVLASIEDLQKWYAELNVIRWGFEQCK